MTFLRFPEGGFRPTDEARRSLLREMRKNSPDIVITHPPRDYHLDHMNVSQCTLEAVHLSWNPTVEPDLPTCRRPKLYYADAWFTPFEPDEYVDISDLIEFKKQALRCHKSQLDPSGPSADDMVAMSLVRDRARGVEARVRYAEAFRLAPYSGSVRTSELLGGA